MCLRAALRYDTINQGFPLRENRIMTRADLLEVPQLDIISPLFSYAVRIQELQLDETDAALLAAAWIFQVFFFVIYPIIQLKVFIFFVIVAFKTRFVRA